MLVQRIGELEELFARGRRGLDGGTGGGRDVRPPVSLIWRAECCAPRRALWPPGARASST
jgi:hypothetical protein